jgi:hypothetical protein
MSRFLEEQNGNENHDEIAGAQTRSDCAQSGEVRSSENGGP